MKDDKKSKQQLIAELSYIRQCNAELENTLSYLKRSEEELRNSEARYRSIFENATQGIYQTTFDDRLIRVNPALARMHGYSSPEEMIQQLPMIKGLAARSEDRSLFLHRLNDKGVVNGFEMEMYKKDGTTIWVSLSAWVVKDADGTPLYYEGIVDDITERKKAEETLRESEGILRVLFNESYHLTGLMKTDGTLIKANATALEFAGIKETDVIGRPFWETPWWSHSVEQKERLRNAATEAAHGDLIRLETYHPDAEGNLHFIDFSIKPVMDENDNVILLIPEGRDITEQKRAEEALRESEEKFRLIFDYAPISISITDQDGLYVDVNARMCERNNLSREEIVGHRVTECPQFARPEDHEETTRLTQKLLEQGWLHNEEIHLFRPIDGERSTAIFSSRLITIAGKTYVISMVLDITERKRTEEALRKSEELYTRLVDSIPDLIVRTDLDGKIFFVNDYALQISGYSREEIEGQNMLMLVSPEDRDRMIQNALLMRERRLGPQEYSLIMKDGRKIPFEVNGDVLRSGDGIPFGLVNVCRNITQRKQAEQEKEQLQAQLIQAQKMESVGRLAGGVAHDFNNMLSVILGNTELAMDRVDPSDPLRKVLQDILNAGQRSADLTRQLLAFARKQIAVPKVLDLNDTVSGMLKMLRRLIGEDIDLSWNPGYNLWKLLIDPSQVDQVLANLTVNARDAIEKSGRIVIDTTNVICDDAYCSVHPECIPGEYVMLSVSDDGCGMDRETLSKIFEPFFTTKKEGHGTGLGLATVYGIVRQNSGFINVYSEAGMGTTFKIYLPRHITESTEPADYKEEVKIPGGTETVLIVEDDEAVLNLSKSMLEKLGYHVLAARRTDEAIRLAREHEVSIDLLLTDVVMPDMNGKELFRQIRSIRPTLVCLYMSGYTEDVIARQGILEEGVQFIPKPFSLRNLALKVREALE